MSDKGDVVNDPRLLLSRLSELAIEASSSESLFEKSAVYAASQSILSRFQADQGELPNGIQDLVARACFHISAALGFDVDNGHSSESHVGWALADLGEASKLLHRTI